MSRRARDAEVRARIIARQREAREKRKRVVRFPTELPRAERILELVQSEALRWYAILTLPQKEYAAQEILARKGIVTYCPSDFKWRKRNKYAPEKELHSYPMMPGWVFAGLPAGTEPWLMLARLNLVRGVVGHLGQPIALRTEAMTEMVRKFRNGFVRPSEERYMQTGREFKAGDDVRIVAGPLRSFDGKVIDITGEVARVVLPFFGSEQVVKIDVGTLVPAA